MAESEPVPTTCVVCCHETRVWALGECNHPTCLLCCARLRVLCDQSDCPVCRLTLKQVAVVSKVQPFQTLRLQHWTFSNRKYDLFFPTRELLMAFRDITNYRCKICPNLPPFKSLYKLKDHVSKTHQLHFCEICLENLKLFPAEFKLYTRQRLTAHRRTGDAEDSSYKGHPLCQFCDERYLDKDALHMHLRKQHFWCHFCESDGKQDFYVNVHSLKSHFKKDHYLCEEGDCSQDVLSAAFRNELDLKAHVANFHTKGLSRAEVKKMRHVPVEFHVNPVAEDTVPVNRRRVTFARDSSGGGQVLRESVRSEKTREKEERDMALAMSASLQETKEESKSAKRSTGRKKVVCAQKNPVAPEPPPPVPPGFGRLETLRGKDTEKSDGVLKSSSDGMVKSGESSVEQRKTASHKTGTVKNGGNTKLGGETWPLLGTTERSQSAAGSSVKDAQTDPSGGSPPPVTPPPGYAKISRPTKTLQLVNSKLSKQPEAPSLKAFPPLVGEATAAPPGLSITADAPGSSAVPAPKSSGGSKVFEDIREALDYNREKFVAFQALSGLFRSEELPLDNYNIECEKLFGHKWAKIGPLVAKAMPKGGKKDELVALFQRASSVSTGGSTSNAKPIHKKNYKAKKTSAPNAWGGGGGEELRGAAVVASRVMTEEDYPTLGTASKLSQAPGRTTGYHNPWNVSVPT